MKPRIITEYLTKDADIDLLKVKEALQFLQRHPEDAIIEFNSCYEGDTTFTVYRYREQTQEEFQQAEQDLQELIDYQAAQEYKEYQRLKKKYDAEGELQ